MSGGKGGSRSFHLTDTLGLNSVDPILAFFRGVYHFLRETSWFTVCANAKQKVQTGMRFGMFHLPVQVWIYLKCIALSWVAWNWQIKTNNTVGTFLVQIILSRDCGLPLCLLEIHTFISRSHGAFQWNPIFPGKKYFRKTKLISLFIYIPIWNFQNVWVNSKQVRISRRMEEWGPSLLWEEYRYFLEKHNIKITCNIATLFFLPYLESSCWCRIVPAKSACI